MKSVRGDKTARVLPFCAIGILLALCDAFWAGLRINGIHNFPVGVHWVSSYLTCPYVFQGSLRQFGLLRKSGKLLLMAKTGPLLLALSILAQRREPIQRGRIGERCPVGKRMGLEIFGNLDMAYNIEILADRGERTGESPFSKG